MLLRFATSVGLRAASRRQRSLRLLSSEAVAVVSRQRYQKHGCQTPRTKAKSKPADETPWPTWSKVAAGAAVATGIPYLSVWIVCANPMLREVAGDRISIDKLRAHFGAEDRSAVPYTEVALANQGMMTTKPLLPMEAYLFPQELPYADRQQQSKIETQDQADVKAIVTASDGRTFEKQLVGGTPATTGAVSQLENGSRAIAVEFNESPIGEFDDADVNATAMQRSFVDGHTSTPAGTTIGPAALRLEVSSQIFSPWQYQQTDGIDSQRTSNASEEVQQRMTSMDVDISRLEYQIQQLEHDLRYSARNIDAVMAELKTARRQLSRCRWKKRLGGII